MQGQKSPKMKRAGTAATIASNVSPKRLRAKPQADDFESRGLTPVEVELEHLRTTVQEIKRERAVTESLQKDNAMLREQLRRSEEVREKQQEHIDSLDKVRIEQQSHIHVLLQENSALKAENIAMLNDKEALQKEILVASDYIVALEDKCYQANKTSLELLNTLRDTELEVETLKAYIIDLKSRIAVYIPCKDSPVDKKLAEFINNYPDRQKLKIMFMRESEGVYEFGSKRINVVVMRDKIQIKVGGGYLSIDEFLDQYTPEELAKLERKDPLKRFAEKVAVQKTLGDRSVSDIASVRKSSSSPTKKIRV